METVTTLEDIRTFETRSGNTRFVLRDADGNEYTTFRQEIGQRASDLKGTRVRITYHEDQRGQYRNVYVDGVERIEATPAESTDTDVQEAAWRTAVEAAPWLVGDPQTQVEPDELYEKLKPFEERVAQDIEQGRDPTTDDE
jgi:hypothetical protein